MKKVLIIILPIVLNANAKVGDICHDQRLGYYYPGVIEMYHNRMVCNFWKFINIDALSDNDRYELENYVESLINGDDLIEDEEYNFSNDVIIDE